MKIFCIIVLIAYIFGDILIPKYGSVKFTSTSGVFYFETSEFDEGSSIYFQLNAENGYVNSDLEYEFSNSDPISDLHIFIRPNTLKVYAKDNSRTYVNDEVTSFREQYYYELENDRNYNYVYVKFTKFFGNYLEIENTKYSKNIFKYIIIGVIGFIVLLTIIFIIVKIIKHRNNIEENRNRNDNLNNEPQYETQTQNPSPDFTPDSYDSNYPRQQQGQNMYYQPPSTGSSGLLN